MKRFVRGLAGFCASSVLVLSPALAAGYTDVQNHWGQEAILDVTDRGFFTGTGEGEFSPDLPMTRGMFVTVLGRMAEWIELPVEAGESIFSDVDAEAYYAPYVGWAYANGIVNGVGNDEFAPNSQITREQMCTCLYRFLSNYAGFDLTEYQQENDFLDQNEISAYAQDAVAVCYGAGIISGVPVENGAEFQPKVQATRAAVAVVLSNAANQIEAWKMEENSQPDPSVPENPNQGGQQGGNTTTPETPEEPDDEPSQEEREQEALVAQYLDIIVDSYHNSSYLLTTDPEVQDCMRLLMNCIEDALKQRENGQFLSREFVQNEYANQIDEVELAYNALTEDQLNQINNVIVRLADTEQIYYVMDYFGVDYVE